MRFLSWLADVCTRVRWHVPLTEGAGPCLDEALDDVTLPRCVPDPLSRAMPGDPDGWSGRERKDRR